jgi:hypothetical protein
LGHGGVGALRPKGAGGLRPVVPLGQSQKLYIFLLLFNERNM